MRTAQETAGREKERPGLLSAVIVNYDGGELLLRCVRSLLQQKEPVQVIVVDNRSTDGSMARAVARFPELEVVAPGRNLGFAGGVNAGARCAEGEFLLFLNPDVELLPGCVRALTTTLSEPTVGVAGPIVKVIASDVVEYGATVDVLGFPVGLLTPGRPLYFTGAALATKRTVFEELGGFDERFFLFAEDVDFCWRALIAGWDVRLANEAWATHVGGSTMPGGYLTTKGFETSRLRVALRERNTLAMLLKCYGPGSLSLVLPAYVGQSMATSLALLLSGSPGAALDIVRGLVWNARELRRTLALRRVTQARRKVSDREIRRRIQMTSRKLELFRRHGIPKVRESWGPDQSTAGSDEGDRPSLDTGRTSGDPMPRSSS